MFNDKPSSRILDLEWEHSKADQDIQHVVPSRKIEKWGNRHEHVGQGQKRRAERGYQPGAVISGKRSGAEKWVIESLPSLIWHRDYERNRQKRKLVWMVIVTPMAPAETLRWKILCSPAVWAARLNVLDPTRTLSRNLCGLPATWRECSCTFVLSPVCLVHFNSPIHWETARTISGP